jgi:pimeloyl-ACP methyl ester carboxylesterase
MTRSPERSARYREAERRLWASVGVQPSERWLTLPAIGTRVRVQEAGEGPPVLFVHGATTAASSWATLVAELDGFRCILLDRPGSGLSEPRPRPSKAIGDLEAFADALVVDVLDALELERAHVVGTSFGGYLTVRAAAARPDRFERLVLIGWCFGAPIGRVPFAMRITAVPGLGRGLAALPPPRWLVVTMLREVGLRQALEAGRVSDETIDCYHSLLRDTPTMRNDIAGAPSVIRPIRGLDERVLLSDDVLGRVRAPVLLLWGDEDLYGGAATARAFSARLPDASLTVLPGAGHAPWMDDARTVASAMSEFLGR